MPPDRDPYAILGVARDAGPEAIVAAYRRLARRHHPDVSGHEDAQQRMAVINAAWATLRDPARLAAWDRARAEAAGAQQAQGVGRPPSPPSPEARPTWRRGPGGEGAAGPPPGSPRGSVLPFGRHIGWSLGEVARVDPGYLVWLADRREGAPYRAEIEQLLGGVGTREEPGRPGGRSRRR